MALCNETLDAARSDDTHRTMASGWRRLLRRLRRWQQVRHERQELWRLSDATLKDIGLSRADIEREASRPFWDDRGCERD
ncbi:uncharacterized protein YjiS (DUF1127 family) [Modicisalibacter xianhensis]|uniref:Uncharacterized protein YjiS (DUF1127 family) n=1 Tax=Modicisalibacter xianhensis TaxID=442341 RepID=A0A4R8G484_9GAMM|nr:DUF1127 domain-containing protein [Halomonas xianhensis]TDX33045.1 uncharacterized protein YjiS (DUF1127 family) [Halomonas xianhensis]